MHNGMNAVVRMLTSLGRAPHLHSHNCHSKGTHAQIIRCHHHKSFGTSKTNAHAVYRAVYRAVACVNKGGMGGEPGTACSCQTQKKQESKVIIQEEVSELIVGKEKEREVLIQEVAKVNR